MLFPHVPLSLALGTRDEEPEEDGSLSPIIFTSAATEKHRRSHYYKSSH